MTYYFNIILLQTESVDGEEHDHRITSRINLIDLAGSERCSTAQTSGDRLKVNMRLFWGTGLAQSVEHVILHLEVVSLNPCWVQRLLKKIDTLGALGWLSG